MTCVRHSGMMVRMRQLCSTDTQHECICMRALLACLRKGCWVDELHAHIRVPAAVLRCAALGRAVLCAACAVRVWRWRRRTPACARARRRTGSRAPWRCGSARLSGAAGTCCWCPSTSGRSCPRSRWWAGPGETRCTMRCTMHACMHRTGSADRHACGLLGACAVLCSFR